MKRDKENRRVKDCKNEKNLVLRYFIYNFFYLETLKLLCIYYVLANKFLYRQYLKK